MNSKYFISIDLGATSGRVILAKCGETIEMETIHRFPSPLIEKEGKYFWDIDSIYSDIVKGLCIVSEKGVEIQSIGIDTWGVDFVKFDKNGDIMELPRAYRDPYTNNTPEEFFGIMPKETLYGKTGIQIMNFNSVFQLFAQNKEKPLADVDKILFMPDALSYMLTGKMVCEYTILSTSALMDPNTKEFDNEILEVCGLKRSQFPEIVNPGTEVGLLKPELAEATNLGAIPVIAVAGHDTASAVAAVPAKCTDFAYLSSGTWSLMGIESPKPVINEQMFSLNYTNEGGIDGTTRILKNITGMWLLEQCLAQFKKEGRTYGYSEIMQMASSCPESAFLINPDAPEFAAPGNMPAAIAAYCEAHGAEAPKSDAELFRLIYDSLAERYSVVFHKLEEVAGHNLSCLHIIGGGSQNSLLNKMTAQRCGVKVIAGPAEGTAYGNVLLQARATGLYPTLSEGRKHVGASIHTEEYN